MEFNKLRVVNAFFGQWRIGALLLWLLGSPMLYAQIGTWQSLASFRPAQSVAVAGNMVYTATENGFFYYDPATGQTTLLAKGTAPGVSNARQPGLTDAGVSRLLYLPDQNRLLIAYRSGQLDFMTLTATGGPGTVTSVSTIATAANISGSRTINHINRVGNNAYLSTDFGVVVLNLTTDDIRDTYFSDRPILRTALAGDSLYAQPYYDATARQRPLRAVRFSPVVNIADPANWRPVNPPAGETGLGSVLAEGGTLLALGQQGVYQRRAGSWVLIQPETATIVLFPGPNGRITVRYQPPAAGTLTVPGVGTFTDSLLTNVGDVAVSNGRVFVADQANGLLVSSGSRFQPIALPGPLSDDAYALYAYPQRLVKLPPAAPAGQPPAELLAVPDNRWLRLPANGDSPGQLSTAAYLPTDGQLYVAGQTGGLWRLAGDTSARFERVAVPLLTQANQRITALAADAQGNLWMGLSGRLRDGTDLIVRRPDGQFQSFSARLSVESNLAPSDSIVQLVPDDNGFVWLRYANAILPFDPVTNRGRLLYGTYYALAKDRSGQIWVGTGSGVFSFENPASFTDPASVFNPAVVGQALLVNGRPLLSNVAVTALAVDGGNRKWIGTAAGLYRVSPDGSQVLDTFTADNSPLPSNTIQALAIEPVSGTVYIQTDKGLIAYRGPATEPAETLGSPVIFPNPVRPDYVGNVGINGLTDNATVKILDAGGMLVYETRSQGGTATWNLLDYRNRPAQTGIYLIVIVAADGSEHVAGKLAVVR